MLMICHRTWSPGAAGIPVPSLSEALTQTEFQKGFATLHVSGCRGCLELCTEAGACDLLACRSCVAAEDLCQVEELWKEVRRL